VTVHEFKAFLRLHGYMVEGGHLFAKIYLREGRTPFSPHLRVYQTPEVLEMSEEDVELIIIELNLERVFTHRL
jgi:hypothetical protein